jgi:hypothetical protein
MPAMRDFRHFEHLQLAVTFVGCELCKHCARSG